MIPYTVALAAWIPVAAFLMADRNSARGFSLAMLGGLLILPAGQALVLPKIPDLDKTAVCALGAFIGTLIFHFDLVLRFRWRWFDLLLVGTLGAGAVTALSNGFGMNEAVSVGVRETVSLLLPLALARIHLSTPQRFRTFLLMLVGAGVIYTPLAIWEWRMSPQIHQTLYGYFQHRFFGQFARWGFFRSVVCFDHSLNLGRFFGFAAFVAAFPMRKELARLFPGIGEIIFLVPLVGMMTTMSVGPTLLFMILCGSYLVLRKWSWLAYIPPMIGAVWAVLLFAGMRPLYWIPDEVAKISADRARSLNYRFEAMDEYRVNILQRPWFGYGRFGNGRIRHIATDSILLIRALVGGFVGVGLLFGWWLYTMHVGLKFAKRIRGSPFEDIAFGCAVLIPLCISVSLIDSAFDLHVVIATSALVGIAALAKSAKAGPVRARRPRAPVRAATDPGAPLAPGGPGPPGIMQRPMATRASSVHRVS